jgi:alkylation response protein AidB-like acyl-CoA dehydrogenase
VPEDIKAQSSIAMAFDMKALEKMGVNVDTFGDLNAFGDPCWYQGFNTPGYYDKSHKELRSLLRKFVDEEVIPNVFEWDEDGRIPQEVYMKVSSVGVLPIAVGRPWPKQWIGECPLGYEPDYFHELIVFDELARCGSGGFMWGLAGGMCIGLPPVLKWAQDEVRAKVVAPVLRAEKVICLAITEPTAGSDVANLKTTAIKEGDHYIVNGEKKWITNGIFADFFTVACRTGSQKDGMKGLSLLLLEKTMPGITTRKMKCSGVWSSGTTYITMEDVKVPASHLIGQENKGFNLIMRNFNHERFGICAMTNRFSRICMEDSLKFANKRKTFGKPLVQHDVIRWKLAEMARMIEATHAWLEQITYQLHTMHGMEAAIKLGGPTALLKVQATKVFEYCAREAAQIFGGLSYTRGGQGERVERLNREVRAMAVPGGSEEIMLDLGIRQQKKLSEMAKNILAAEPKAKL